VDVSPIPRSDEESLLSRSTRPLSAMRGYYLLVSWPAFGVWWCARAIAPSAFAVE
jgi:hypothetical protein